MSGFNTKISLYYAEQIPRHSPLVVVSNHRSFMDPPLLMVALNRTIRFACHRYMAQVPFLRDVINHMGGFALDSSIKPSTNQKPVNKSSMSKHQTLVSKASQFLSAGDVVGIFPEGAQPMVHYTDPDALGQFHRGFAHLLLRSPIPQVTILPVAIASRRESSLAGFPVRLLQWFDPSEPLFDQNGWHPMVVYHEVNVMVGAPLTITADDQKSYQGRQGKVLSRQITQRCQEEIHGLLHQGLKL